MKQHFQSDSNPEICYICDAELHAFMTTPILELPDGTLKSFCETCADREFPEWDKEDEEDI